MLVLTGKEGQRVVIGRGIELEVLEVRENRVRLALGGASGVPTRGSEPGEPAVYPPAFAFAECA